MNINKPILARLQSYISSGYECPSTIIDKYADINYDVDDDSYYIQYWPSQEVSESFLTDEEALNHYRSKELTA